MPRAVAYDKLLKLLSSAVVFVLVFVAVVETDLLPSNVSMPLKVSIRAVGDRFSRLPVVSEILRGFY
jgi:hypothetical protein